MKTKVAVLRVIFYTTETSHRWSSDFVGADKSGVKWKNEGFLFPWPWDLIWLELASFESDP